MDNHISHFAQAVMRNPSATAIVDREGARSVSYAQLYSMSRAVASKIMDGGIQVGAPVLIVMDRCAEYLAAYLGIHMAGCAAVPLTMEYPGERVELIRANCGASLAITEAFFRDIDAVSAAKTNQEAAQLEPQDALLRPVNADTPQHIVYTSGSTGKPKGVLHTVESIYKFACGDTASLWDVGEGSVYASVTTFSFAAAIFDTLCPLHRGGVLHILSDRIRKDVFAMSEYFACHKVTMAFMSPGLLKNFHCGSTSLRRVVCAGEMAGGIYCDRYETICAYGSSECGLVSSFRIDRPYDNTPIGKPFPECEFRQLPDGELGVVVKTAGRYLDLPEQNEKTFEALPDGRILYHSGDIVREEPDGNYVFVSRKDWMVKVNGQRVETLEVEIVMKQCPGVEGAAVKAFADSDSQTYLCGYFTGPAGADEVRAALQEKLPPYMIPRFLVRLDSLPLNQNGKLDRMALLPPSGRECRSRYRAPKSDLQKMVCSAFEKVLGCCDIGLDDNFVSLGGDSLKVQRLSGILKDKTLLNLRVAELLRAGTPENIARLLSDASSGAAAGVSAPAASPAGFPAASPAGKAAPVPLTFSQQGVYMECIQDPQSTMYNIPFALRLPPETDLDRFEEAVCMVARQHPALHATIAQRGGVPVMIPPDKEEIRCKVLRRRTEDMLQARLAFVRPFDLENGPLYRFELCSTPQGTEFLMDVHHLVFDGTSFSLFMSEICGAYAGEDPAPEKVTLFDYARDEAAKGADTSEINRAAEFFKTALEGAPQGNPLVADVAPGPEGPSSRSTAGHIVVQAQDSLHKDCVEDFTRREGITENSLFLSAFAYTLSVFAASDEVCFTTASNGRGDPDLSATVGMFVKTLPLHIEIPRASSVREFLHNSQETFLNTMRCDCIPFGRLAHEFGVDASVSFVYQSELLSEIRLGDSLVRPVELDVNGCQGDLLCMVLKTHGRYSVSLHYRSDRFSEGMMRSFAAALLSVAAQMTCRDALGDISASSLEDRSFVDRFNDTRRPDFKPATVNDLFEKTVRQYPARTAVVYKDRSLSYADLQSDSARIAAFINDRGIGAEDFVAVLVPRDETMVQCAWGVIRSGAALQPMDPTYPKDRLDYMLQDSGARLLIARRSLLPLVQGFEGDVLYTDEIPSLPEAPAGWHAAVKPQDAAVLLYTSGTTGKPKGCVLENRNLAAFRDNYVERAELSTQSRVASYASFGFDAGIQDIVAVPTTGGAVYIIPDEIRLDLQALEDFYCTNGITNGFLTTQLGRMFAMQTHCPSLKVFFAGGEKLVPFLPQSGFKFINAYGPSETMAYVCSHVVSDDSPVQPIGKPSGNTKLYVVDKNGALSPVGACGELCISGAQVGRGYLGLPEKTAEVFVCNPFENDADGIYSRMYRTGDVVRLLPCGEIDYVGRRDGQVKVRGFRVELTEVEEALRRFGPVKDATVAAFDDPAGGKFLAAYVVGDSAIDVEQLKEFISQDKPSYMVPAAIMQLDAIPYTHNLKVNRRALPKPELLPADAQDLVPPQTEGQKKILDIASEILGRSDLGMDTDLFRAGLTSIGMLKLNARLSEAFGTAAKISDIRQNASIRALDALFSAREDADRSKSPASGDCPLMQNQTGVFLECQSNPGTLQYNIPMLLHLQGQVDARRLCDAVKAAIDAHPFIKTRLHVDESGDVRALRRDGDVPLVEMLRLEKEPDATSLCRPFELLDSPLYRAAVIESPRGTSLWLDFHHIIADGTSTAIFLRDVETAYEGKTPDKESYTIFDASLDEEQLLRTDAPKRSEEHFATLLDGCNTDCLPQKCPQYAPASGCDSADATVEGEGILSFCRCNGLSLNAFFNSVFAFVLSEFIHGDDVTYCTVYNGRGDSRLERSFAMLVRTLPVRCAIDPSQDILSFVRKMQDQLMDSMAADAMSFIDISRKFGVRPDIFFNYQGDDFVFDSLAGHKVEMELARSDEAKSPLSVETFLQDGSFRFHLAWDTSFFCEDFARSLADTLCCAAVSFTRVPSLDKVCLLSSRQEALLARMNDTAAPVRSVSVQSLFEAHAAAQPQRTAVISPSGSLSYAQLDEKANRLANALIDKGLGNNEIIGVMLERTHFLPVAELGVLKAGCAFLPILPSYPKDRVDYCLKDAGCRFVITEENVASLASFPDARSPKLPFSGSDLAYCIYTSGSTGTPKGVMVEQHNMSNCVQTSALAQTQRKCSVIMCMSSISFDMSITEQLSSLCQGLTIRIATEDEIHNPDRLLEAVESAGVDLMIMTPSFAWNLLSLPQSESSLRSLKAVILGAEAFNPALFEKFRAINPDILVQNGYGPTECTQACSAQIVTDPSRVTIGKPFANTTFHVMDAEGRILPLYAAGELVIGGEGVCRGYVNLPEKNKAAFLTLSDGSRAYRSGDLVRINGDLEAQFIGRKDNQVKLRGFRIELDEVENVMLRYPSLKQCKVVVRNNGQQEAFLAGYFTAEGAVDTEKLRAFMKEYLTNYMVPAALMQLDSMPMTKGGKLDARALPEIRPQKRERAGKAPKKSLEARIAELFASLLGLEECYVDDNFFEIGGTSLSASKAVMKLKAEGWKIEYQDIFDNQSAESLAACLEERRVGNKAPDAGSCAGEGAQLYHMEPDIAEVLSFNSMENASKAVHEPLGDVLLTGATGFLGCHVLRELLSSEEGHIWCLLRKGKYESVQDRLRQIMFYYFESRFDEEFRSRITVVEGDVTHDDLPEKLRGIHFDTVINCAACVKHYANDNSIEFVNVHGVENLIKACTDCGARLIQISTTSIPGAHTGDSYKVHLRMPENKLFVVDDMGNQYAQSKYKSELLMLRAIRGGLRGKIVRVGNLMGRNSDGQFQINMRTNAFLNGLRGFVSIGKCPISHSTDLMGFSPVDCTAKAIVLLAGTPDGFTAFNADSRSSFDEMKLIEAVNRCGISIRPVPDEEYYEDFRRMMDDPSRSEKVSALLTNDRPDVHIVETDNRFTANVLYRLGFSWPFVDDAYLEKTIRSLSSLGFFM